MGFPAGMQLATIAFGIPLTATGKEVVTKVRVKPTSRVIWAATGQPLPEFEDSFTAEAGQLGQFQIPFVDQPGFIDSAGNAVTDFAYRISGSWEYGNERPINWDKNLKPLLGQSGPIDLDLVPDGPVSIPVTAPTASVLGFNGRTGFITLTDADLPARLSPEELSATYATTSAIAGKADLSALSSRPNTVIAIGTSITNQGSFASPSSANNQFQNGSSDVGYLSHAIVLLDHDLRILRNAGISGNNTLQMRDRLQADVIAHNPGYVIVESGAPNDLGVGHTLAQAIGYHKEIYDTLKTKGIRVIATTPMPYGTGDAATGSGLGRRQFLSGLRRWIMKYCQEQGHIIADFYPALVREDGSGLWRGTGWSDGANGTGSDGIHPKPPAAAVAGRILADALRPHVPRRKDLWLPGGNVDTWNLLANGMMTGTGGTTKPTGVTGDLATSWAAYGFSGTGGAGTLSKIPRTDGINGEWQRYTATAGNTDGFNLQQQNQAGLGSTWNVGDVVAAAVEFSTENDWTGGVQLGATFSCFGSTGITYDLRHAGADTGWAPGKATGLLLSKMTVTAGTTRLQIQASVKMTTGTVDFGRVGMWNLTQMSAAGIVDPALLTAPTL